MKLRIFIDYWNFSLNFDDRGKGQCDWTKLANVLTIRANTLVAKANLGEIQREETRVYASYEPGTPQGKKQRTWLQNFLDRQPGFCVIATERHWKERPIYCRACQTSTANCPNCKKPFGRAAEKKVDARIVADMMALAWEGAYDVALLVSSDADFIPAVEALQRKNIKVVNATWRKHGHDLAKTCWASFQLDDLVKDLIRG